MGQGDQQRNSPVTRVQDGKNKAVFGEAFQDGKVRVTEDKSFKLKKQEAQSIGTA